MSTTSSNFDISSIAGNAPNALKAHMMASLTNQIAGGFAPTIAARGKLTEVSVTKNKTQEGKEKLSCRVVCELTVGEGMNGLTLIFRESFN